MHSRRKHKKLLNDILKERDRHMKKSKTPEKEPLITIASNNLFLDSGRSPEEAINLQARTDIMIFIRMHILGLKWSQRKAAAEFGIPQPRIAEIMSGKIEKFSVDQLLKYVSLMGMTVNIQIEPATKMIEIFDLDELDTYNKNKNSVK